MTNEEMKKKIVDVINAADISVVLRRDDIIILADALIAAGIGDVKEVEHRVAVAERALKHAVNVYIAHTETSSQKKWWYKYFLREAEKELAEERKDD